MASFCHASATPGPTIADPSAYLHEADSLHLSDHPRFVQMLAQLHQADISLTEAQRLELEYQDGWEIMYEGHYPASEQLLRDVMEHAGNPLRFKAMALLTMNLAVDQRYEEAFALNDKLISALPVISDVATKYSALAKITETLYAAGQVDAAMVYAEMMERNLPPGMSPCEAQVTQVDTLFEGNRLRLDSPILQRATKSCASAGRPLLINTLQLVEANLWLDQHQPAQALQLLDQIKQSIDDTHYYSQQLSWRTLRTQAYAALGDDERAITQGLATLSFAQPGDTSDWMMDTYQTLYEVEKQRGNLAQALNYFEQYHQRNNAHLNDVRMQAMAYASVQQANLAQKVQADHLSEQNRILQLQQSLDRRKAENSRLLIISLLLLIAIALWALLQLKRSQLRFKLLSQTDGLTGAINHQHFMQRTAHGLHGLQRRGTHGALLYLDLDHFKQINDNYGHPAGDAVIRKVVAISHEHLRPHDMIGRLGGEEFAIFLPDCNHARGKAAAERIRAAIADAQIEADGITIRVTVSIGVSATDRCGYTLTHLCRHADKALYHAKHSGRNRVITDNPVTEELNMANQALLLAVRQQLQNDSIEPLP